MESWNGGKFSGVRKGSQNNLCCAQSLLLSLTLCDPMDCRPPGSSDHGDFFQQRYWGRFSCLPLGYLPIPGTEPASPTLVADSLPTEPPGDPGSRQLWSNIPVLNLLPPHFHGSVRHVGEKLTSLFSLGYFGFPVVTAKPNHTITSKEMTY